MTPHEVEMSDLTCEYIPPGVHGEHIWTCVGPEFALHFHVTDTGRVDDDRRYYGGLEIHYRQAPEYMSDKSPSQTDCWLLKGPCWHDGTSLYAREFLIPFWRQDPENNERMFALLKREYEQRK